MALSARLPESVLRGLGPEVRVVVLGRVGCHLCDAAHDVVRSVTEPLGVGVAVLDIDAHPELLRPYAEQIPVTFVDGARHDFWRVDPGRLRAALG